MPRVAGGERDLGQGPEGEFQSRCCGMGSPVLPVQFRFVYMCRC